MARIKQTAQSNAKSIKPGYAVKSTTRSARIYAPRKSMENVATASNMTTTVEQTVGSSDISVQDKAKIKQLVRMEGCEYPCDAVGFAVKPDGSIGAAVKFPDTYVVPTEMCELDLEQDLPTYSIADLEKMGHKVVTPEQIEKDTQISYELKLREMRQGKRYYRCAYCLVMPSKGRIDLARKHMDSKRQDGTWRCPCRPANGDPLEPKEIPREEYLAQFERP